MIRRAPSTQGKPAITDIIPAADTNIGVDEMLAITTSVEKGSEHALGEAIVRAAEDKGLDIIKADKFSSIADHGVEATVNGSGVILGTCKLMADNNVDFSILSVKMENLESQGKTAMILAIQGEAIGLFAVADTIKDHSKEAVSEIRKMGIDVVMMTGDNKSTAEAIASQLGIDKVLSEILPGDKASDIKRLQEEGRIVSMVGDGIHDAPALTQSDIGIAMGTGTDVAIESAEIVLIKNDPRDVISSIRLSRLTMRKIKQSLFWEFGYNSMGIPLAAGILYPFINKIVISPELAAAFMALSSVSVTANSLIMKRSRVK